MNDDFLSRFRKSPRREFATALYERINTPMNTHNKFSVRRLTFAAALCLAVAAALAFSPAARAALEYIVREIGGVTYLEPEVASAPLPESQVTLVPEETLSLEAARAKLPYEFNLPAWAPEGYVMGTSVRMTYFTEQNTRATITWHGSDAIAGPIILMVGQPVKWVVDLDHLEEVQINGQPAGLTGGNWDADTGEWSGSDITLTWIRGDVMYQLMSHGAAVEDLIRMAESVP